MTRPAVFLDRDGTIIEEKGFIGSPAEVSFLPGVFSALRKLQNNFLLFIVTNQPGVGLGRLRLEEVKEVNQFILSTLAHEGIRIQKVFTCPHRREDNCQCIKPKPYFLLQAAEEFNLDLVASYVIGDHPSDMELARASGARGVYLLTGHGPEHLSELAFPLPVVTNLETAVALILEEKKAVEQAARIIREGGVIAFPTETVYGLGADAFNRLAVARVFDIKKRPRFDPLIVHIAAIQELEKLASKITEEAWRLAQHFWPGPLTLVLPKKKEVPEIVTSGLTSVAVRMPRHNLTLRVITEAVTPVVGPSANPFGYLSPTRPEHVREQLGSSVDFILDGGPCEIGVESTIVSFLERPPRLLRPGGVPVEEIERFIGHVKRKGGKSEKTLAPGMLPRHYSPSTPLVLTWSEETVLKWKKEGKRVGLLCLQGQAPSILFDHQETLSAKGDLREAAANLFAALHRLDKAGLDLIVVDRIPEEGLGAAIMDRLRRGSSDFKNEKGKLSLLP